MKKTANYLVPYYLVFTTCCSFAQNPKIDSLLSLVKMDMQDTNKANHLYQISREFEISGDFEKGLIYGKEANELAVKLNFKKGIANANNSIGNMYRLTAEYPKALDHYRIALKMDEELKDKSGMGKRLSNMGIVYRNQGDYPKALDYYLKALKIDEELKDKGGMGKRLGNIGIIYHQQGDFPKALDYYLKAFKIAEELGNKNGMTVQLGNIGNVYYNQGNYPKALDYYFKALDLGKELGDKGRIAIQLSNIGTVYYDKASDPKVSPPERDQLFGTALDYFLRSLPLKEGLGDKGGIAITLGGIGSIYMKTGKFKEAEVYLQKAIAINTSIGALDYLRQYEMLLSQLYNVTNRHKLALEHYKIAMALKDTLFNEEKNKELTRKEMNYEFEKKEAATRAEQEKQQAVASAESRRQRLFLWLVIAIACAVAAIAVVIFRALRITRKQKSVIEHQKKLVEEHQKDILDSIYYARRIQRSLMTNEWQVQKYLERLMK